MARRYSPRSDEPGSPEPNAVDATQPIAEGAPTAAEGMDGEFSEPVVLPITDILDLHSISPRDAQAVVEEYLHECYRLKLSEIRIIHGRGIGFQRSMVRKVLEQTEFVVCFGDAPMEAGGWGATVATLRKREDKPD